MKLLAIETTGAYGGVALLQDGAVAPLLSSSGVLAEASFALKRQTATELLPAIDRLFRENQWQPAALDAIAVSVGPGSFTGIRIGIATAQGIAAAGRLPVYGISSLAVLAMSAGPRYEARSTRHEARVTKTPSPASCLLPPASCAVLRHARADEYYFCLYQERKELIPEGRYTESTITGFLQEAGPKTQLIVEEGITYRPPQSLLLVFVRPAAAALGLLALETPLQAAFPGGIGLTPRFY